jgi:hypothetical protein
MNKTSNMIKTRIFFHNTHPVHDHDHHHHHDVYITKTNNNYNNAYNFLLLL